jgi:hypothetical protein
MNRRAIVAFVVLAVAGLSTPCRAQNLAPGSVYSVKFVCGLNSTPVDTGSLPSEPPVKPGNYATAINIHNFHTVNVGICKKAVLAPPEKCLSSPTPSGCFPGIIGKPVSVGLAPDQAFEIDCNDIVGLLTPSLPKGTTLPPFIKGFVEIGVAPEPGIFIPGATSNSLSLSVTAVYTAQGCKSGTHDNKTCDELGGIAEEVVPQNSFNLEAAPCSTTSTGASGASH